MNIEEMRDLAEEMVHEAVRAADPERLVRKNIKVEGDEFEICGKKFSREDYTEVVVFGIGKASVPMASGLEELNPDDGLVITKSGKDTDLSIPAIEVEEASHPYPEKANLEASDALLSKLGDKEDAFFLFLISGGGSALFLSPAAGINIKDMKELNELLVKSGADIHKINSVRKHLSEVKGGRLGEKLTRKGDVVSLIVSDVVGDDMGSIASGPTYPDLTTYKDAVEVLKRYDLWDQIPESVREHLERGLNDELEETPKRLDVENFVIGNNMTALQGAKRVAEKNNFNSIILTSQNIGEAKGVAKPYTGIAKETQDSNSPLEPPAALIFGGEMTVGFRKGENGVGKGGPNREFLLSSALEIRDRENIVVISVDSDGIDGMEKAGAVADTTTIERSDLNAKRLLEKHDSQAFFESINDSIEFESETNVNDISVILIEEKD